jgi:hypothetical protein
MLCDGADRPFDTDEAPIPTTPAEVVESPHHRATDLGTQVEQLLTTGRHGDMGSPGVVRRVEQDEVEGPNLRHFARRDRVDPELVRAQVRDGVTEESQYLVREQLAVGAVAQSRPVDSAGDVGADVPHIPVPGRKPVEKAVCH